MRSRQLLPRLLLATMLGAAGPAFSQVAPSATGSGGLPLSVGAGISDFNPDFDDGRMIAGVLWIDYSPPLPRLLHGFGLEVEGDDVAFDRNKSQTGTSEQVASGGVTYATRSFHGVRPYGKYLLGFGNVDYQGGPTGRTHQTRTVTTIGGGALIGESHGFSLRAEYVYQFWPDFWASGASLSPSGITVGFSYRLDSLHLHF